MMIRVSVHGCRFASSVLFRCIRCRRSGPSVQDSTDVVAPVYASSFGRRGSIWFHIRSCQSAVFFLFPPFHFLVFLLHWSSSTLFPFPSRCSAILGHRRLCLHIVLIGSPPPEWPLSFLDFDFHGWRSPCPWPVSSANGAGACVSPYICHLKYGTILVCRLHHLLRTAVLDATLVVTSVTRA